MRWLVFTVRMGIGSAGALGCVGQSPVLGESEDSLAQGPEADHESVGSPFQVIERVEGDTCLPFDLSFDPETGMVPCTVTESVFDTPAESCSCEWPKMLPDPKAVSTIRRELQQLGECDGPGNSACADVCVCEVLQAQDAQLEACRNDVEPIDEQEYCIIDADQGFGNPELVEDCPPSRPTLLRLDAVDPAPNAVLHLTCLGSYGSHEVRELGEPCTPTVENDSSFPFFTAGSTLLETGAPGCASGSCVVHNFQGRVSCPYGQSEEQAQSDPACFVPGTGAPVLTAVEPQLLSRPAEAAAICSCQCDGPGGGSFCECPDSMECAPLFDDAGIGALGPLGSYCVPRGSLVAETGRDGPVCDVSLENCGPIQE